MSDRVCSCGCGASLAGLRPQARYASDACRTRGWKARTGYADQRASKPSRNGRQRARRAPEQRIAFGKAAKLLVDRLGPAGEAAALVLRELLSDAAREHLAEREATPTP